MPVPAFPVSTFTGTLYRAVHPRSGVDPLSGRWSAQMGGRFNRVGREALYTSLSPITSVKEVFRTGRPQPILILALEADLDRIVDAESAGLDVAALATPMWREGQVRREVSPSQALAESLIADGAHGLLVRSFAPDAGPLDRNLVLWRWSPATLRVIDDERRLPAPVAPA